MLNSLSIRFIQKIIVGRNKHCQHKPSHHLQAARKNVLCHIRRAGQSCEIGKWKIIRNPLSLSWIFKYQFMIRIIAAIEGAIGSKSTSLIPESGHVWRPYIYMKMGHGRSVTKLPPVVFNSDKIKMVYFLYHFPEFECPPKLPPTNLSSRYQQGHFV